MNKYFALAGAGLVVIALAWGGLHQIGKLNEKVGGLEADYAQLEREVEAMAKQRRADELALDAFGAELRLIRDRAAADLGQLARALLESEESRAWAGAALPDDIAGLFFKSEPLRGRAEPAGHATD